MQPEIPPQQPPPAQPYYPPQPERRSSIPIWAWILIGCGGCGCSSFIVLAAILFPVFAQAREKARQISCMTNIRQTSLGMLMYSQDYDNTFPATAEWKPAIFPYVKNEAVFHCPSVSGPAATEASPYGYAFNSDLLKRTLDKVDEPNTTRMIFESSNLGVNAADPGTSLPSPGRHTGDNNIGYVDGHVKSEYGTSAGKTP